MADKLLPSTVLEQAHRLVSTSVKDMRLRLPHLVTREDMRVLGAALNIARARHQKTKTRILEVKINRLRRELAS